MKRRDRIKKKFSALKFEEEKNEPQTESEQEKNHEKTSKSIYYKHYKILLWIPLILLIASIILIGVKEATTGEFINKGISLKGGISVQIPATSIEIQELEQKLSAEFPKNEISIRTIEKEGEKSGYTIESNIITEETDQVENFKNKISEITGTKEEDMTIQTIGATLGDAFFKQTMVALLIAFIFMSIVVFARFKTFVPSGAVVLAALTNILVTVAILNIIDFRIGTAGIAALLMIIGYSIDTDILLTTRVVKEKEGTVYQRIIESMKTGLTMTFTTMAAVLIIMLATNSDILKEFTTVLLIGLILDLVNTWFQNASILRIYMEKKEQKEKASLE